MSKLFIKNRKGQKVAVLIDLVENQKGLAFVMHGLGGWKEQPCTQAMADGFRDAGYRVVRFDTTNTFGESEGIYEDATTTNYYEDLQDVIAWAKTQPWYQEPFYLCGHSLGGLCVALYAEAHPRQVKALAPIATVVSGKLSMETRDLAHWREWKRRGWEEHKSGSVPGRMKRLKWSHMDDRLKYDLLLNVGKLTMPVLLVVGSGDDSTPPEQQQLLHDALPSRRELHVIEGAGHTFNDSRHLARLRQIIGGWLAQISG